MSSLPIEQGEQLRVGTVDFVSPNEIRAVLDIDSPDSVALNAGTPRNFPRVNSYVLVSCDNGYLVGQIEWLAVERSPYPKQRDIQDFGLVNLPFPQKKVSLNPVGTLKRISKQGIDTFKFQRGSESFPSIGSAILLPTDLQLRSIIESGNNRRVVIGQSPLANNANVAVDPDRLFGRHIAVLGNTGSGKSCSVAGLIQWSLEAALESESKPNARFIVLDPNGEYTRALGPDTKFKGRVFKVEAGQDENQLQVPSWFWNSSEWASFTRASPKAQLPLLKRSLRAMRNEEFELHTNLDLEVKKYLGTILVSLRADKSKGSASLNDFPGAKNLLAKIDAWRQSLEEYQSKLTSSHLPLDKLIVDIQDFCAQRSGRYPDYNAQVSAVDNLINGILLSFHSFGGNEDELFPKSEDIPVPFDGGNLVSYLEALAQENGSEQYVEYLVARIRTMLSDTRMKPITNDAEQRVDLAEWLENYIGKDGEDESCVSIIDLSLVPNEITHLLTAVISRIIFESLQRYRRLYNKSLPTVLVAEEAHTFIKRYRDDSENQDVAAMCCQVFEKIAREGRKFGLGMVISSQRPSELSPTVLSQCNTFLLHRISNDRDQEQVHKMVPDNLRGLLRELPSLPSQHAILMGWASELPVLVKMKNLTKEQQPHSDDPDFWDVWSRKDKGGNAVKRNADWNEVVKEWQQS
ncbi:ATP-binding protein [uncultured Alteromonas sp.]|uniref:ATP-binding protein n=1 Tax=uncultured Alteromonas sp. TaxID=179113 RepID=UPI0030CF55C0|tara:strand:- start:13014 stop:15080 length:2067 start_codon:yes stop_codon:yes gene_type:complete